MSRPSNASSTTGYAPRPARDTDTDTDTRLWCSVETLSSPAGDVVVLRVAGEADAMHLPVLDAALGDVLDRRPDRLVVDLSALAFCDVRSLSAIARAARLATRDGTGCAISGASRLFVRLWTLFWPDQQPPRLHRSTADAVLVAGGLHAQHKGNLGDDSTAALSCALRLPRS